MKLSNKLILALDVDSLDKAKVFINKLYPQVRIFKVGLQLFTACGPGVIEFINNKGAEVFLDLKLFDIPNTVANAVRQAVRLKVKMLTLHISGQEEMLKAAVRAAKEESAKVKVKRPLLIGVTVLTSQKAGSGEVLKLAKQGISCGLDGVVCSAQEASLLKSRIKEKFLVVTPGIRPKGASVHDQKRTMSASEALKAGSDFLVVGRPILEAANPLKAVKEL